MKWVGSAAEADTPAALLNIDDFAQRHKIFEGTPLFDEATTSNNELEVFLSMSSCDTRACARFLFPAAACFVTLSLRMLPITMPKR